MQPGGEGDGDRRGRSPTRTGRRSGRRRRRRRTTAIALAPAEPIATSSPSSRSARQVGRGRRARAADDHARRPVVGGGTAAGRGSVESVRPERGERHGAGDGRAVDRQRDVHGPVDRGGLAELAGAVERIDDPHPLGAEPDGVVDALLGQHGVVGACWRRRAPT